MIKHNIGEDGGEADGRNKNSEFHLIDYRIGFIKRHAIWGFFVPIKYLTCLIYVV